MGVLGEVLGAHEPGDSAYECWTCDWRGDYEDDEDTHDGHVERMLLARVADVLGSDETRESIAERLSWADGEFTRYRADAHPDHNRFSWNGDGHLPGPGVRTEVYQRTDAALAAVREVLGLPQERAEGSLSDERAESGPLGVERVVEDVDGEWEK